MGPNLHIMVQLGRQTKEWTGSYGKICGEMFCGLTRSGE